MEGIRIDETQEGCIKIEFSHKYLQTKGVTIQALLMDMNTSRNLVGEVLMELGYSETDFEESSFVIDARLNATNVAFAVYTPHTLTHHPYILNGEKYDVPPEPIGFIVLPDDYLGGICECVGCKHVRHLFDSRGIAPLESNAPKTGSTFEFGSFDAVDDDDDDDDLDIHEEPNNQHSKPEFFPDVHIAPKATMMQPVSNIDSEERNVDFDIHEELIKPKPPMKTPMKPKPTPKDFRPYRPNHLVFYFREIDEVIKVAKVLGDGVDYETSFYSFENRYYLVYDIEDFGHINDRDDIYKDISAINFEHGGIRSKRTKYYLDEYGKELIGTNAFSTLLKYFK